MNPFAKATRYVVWKFATGKNQSAHGQFARQIKDRCCRHRCVRVVYGVDNVWALVGGRVNQS